MRIAHGETQTFVKPGTRIAHGETQTFVKSRDADRGDRERTAFVNGDVDCLVA
jgi:hypothetical protein